MIIDYSVTKTFGDLRKEKMMKMAARQVRTTADDLITIRSACAEDAEALVRIEAEPADDGDWSFSKDPSTPWDQRLHKKRHWISWHAEQAGGLFLVAEMDGEIVGWICCSQGQDRWHAHRGTLTIVFVVKERRHRGIGSSLTGELLGWADEGAVLKSIGLKVVSLNEPAIRLYRRYGFTVEGTLRRSVRLDEERYADEILMSRHCPGEG